MQTATGAFDTAVNSADQMIAYTVTVTFPGSVQASFSDLSGCVVSADWYRQENTTLPDGTTLIAGYPTVQPKIVLAGMLNQGDGVVGREDQNAFWLFNVNDPSSPMYRKTRLALPVTISMGLYDGSSTPELITQFTGTIDSIDCSDGEVTLTCRDNRSTITSQATAPPVITNPPYNAGLTSEFAVDYLARFASPTAYLSRPARRANCVLDVGFRASIYPELGILPSRFTQGTPTFIPGVNGSALGQQPDWDILYQPEDPLTGLATSFVPADKMCGRLDSVGDATNGFTVNLGDDTGTYQFYISRNIATGQIVVFTNSPSGFSSITVVSSIAAGNHTVEWSASWPSGSSSVSGTVWIDGASHAFTFSAANTRPSNENFTLVSVQGPIEALQITKEASYATGYPFTPTLVLDQSLNPLVALPDVSGKDTWSVLQTIAQAEAAVIGFDEHGVLRFTNRNTIKSAASARSITSTTSLMSLDSSEQMSLAATHIQQPVNAIAIGSITGVWSANTAIEVPAASSLVLPVQTQNIVLNVDTTGVGFWPVGGPANVTSFRASTTADGTGAAVSTGIVQTVAQQSATQLTITIQNTNPFPIFLVSPASCGDVATGTPFLFIAAQPVISATTVPVGGTTASDGALIADAQWPPLTAGGAVANDDFGEVLLPLPANDWVQDFASAQALVDDLLSDLFYPKPQYSNVVIIPDPRLQLLDRVTLVDTDVSQANFDALINGINISIAHGTWSQALDVRAFVRPGAWILDTVGRSELDSTTFIY